MMQLARQLSRLFAAKQSPARKGFEGDDVRGSFREERAAITHPEPIAADFFRSASAYLSDTLDSTNPFWQPDADFGSEIDGGFQCASRSIISHTFRDGGIL